MFRNRTHVPSEFGDTVNGCHGFLSSDPPMEREAGTRLLFSFLRCGAEMVYGVKTLVISKENRERANERQGQLHRLFFAQSVVIRREA